MRSFVFNEVLAQRIQQGLWGKTLPGDVMDEADRPTGPLWGRGELRSTGAARDAEMAALADAAALKLRNGLERAGLSQERRALRLWPGALAWEWPEQGVLRLRFSLPPGGYATAVLRELGDCVGAGGES